MLSYSATLIFDTFHKVLTMCRHGDVLVFFVCFFFFHDASAGLRFSVPAFQVSLYEKKIKMLCSHDPAVSFKYKHKQIFSRLLLSRFYWEDSPRRNSVHQSSSEGEGKKNKNLNKYFIRLFCDLMCFCSAEVWGNISAPFINALPQAYPTIV